MVARFGLGRNPLFDAAATRAPANGLLSNALAQTQSFPGLLGRNQAGLGHLGLLAQAIESAPPSSSPAPAPPSSAQRKQRAKPKIKTLPDVAGRVKQNFQAIAPFDITVVDSREKGISQNRKLEFYPPGAPNNPVPGKPTVEVFDPSFQGQDLERIIAADFMHYLPRVDPGFRRLRERFRASITPEQRAIDREAYRRAVRGDFGPKETRPFGKWYEVHRLDQYLGAMFLPEGSANRQDWLRMMTPKQRGILRDIENYLRTGGLPSR